MRNHLLLIVGLCCPVLMISQDLEISGKARIGTMDKVNTADSVVVILPDGALAKRDASTLAIAPGTTPGEMLYWNGTAWVHVTATEREAATLKMINGIPTWTGGTTITTIVDVTNPTTGEIWMDRNLGATQTATSSDDSASYGDLYQWGRFSDGHQNRMSLTTSNLSTSDQPGHDYFITFPSSPFDWRSGQNGSLWQGVIGINNPCPSGYRLPTEAEWEAERASWSSNNTAGALNSPLKLPAGGGRSHANGSLGVDVGFGGYYWSSTVNGVHSRRLYFIPDDAFMSTGGRADALAVRCIKD